MYSSSNASPWAGYASRTIAYKAKENNTLQSGVGFYWEKNAYIFIDIFT